MSMSSLLYFFYSFLVIVINTLLAANRNVFGNRRNLLECKEWKKEQDPKVTTNCRGNENEHFVKCAINNNQIRKRLGL